MKYIDHIVNSQDNLLYLPADLANDRIDKLERVRIAALQFIILMEELIPGCCIDMCPELVAAVREASQ